MNEVYMSGKIVKLQRCAVHLEADRFFFLLQVTHKMSSGQVTIEKFIVYTWNEDAKWAAQHLQAGDEVLVKGMLTHIRSIDERVTVISALRIIITQHNEQQPLCKK